MIAVCGGKNRLQVYKGIDGIAVAGEYVLPFNPHDLVQFPLHRVQFKNASHV